MPDKRWKDVERNVATKLNEILSDAGKFTPIERIPLLGREGPDLTVNETGLVINVKSRQFLHPRLFAPSERILYIGTYSCFRLEDLCKIPDMPFDSSTELLKKLDDWWKFMDKWTKEFKPKGITSIIIHRPTMPIGHAGVVIHHTDLWRLSCQIKTQSS